MTSPGPQESWLSQPKDTDPPPPPAPHTHRRALWAMMVPLGYYHWATSSPMWGPRDGRGYDFDFLS